MSSASHNRDNPHPNVALFVTCLVDLVRPSVAFNAIALLESAGCTVSVPQHQTCCGQPAYNTGAYKDTAPVARQVIETFADYDYVVVPSGSCASMIKLHYPALLEGEWQQRARELADRTWELTTFLAEVALPTPPETDLDLPATAYHDSCAGLRELGIREQPRALLAAFGTEVRELPNRDVCCGFGGTFCAKMPELSTKMADDKLAAAQSTGAQLLTGGDLGCLLNLSGRAHREGISLEFRHVAELLNADLTTPAIGAPEHREDA